MRIVRFAAACSVGLAVALSGAVQLSYAQAQKTTPVQVQQFNPMLTQQDLAKIPKNKLVIMPAGQVYTAPRVQTVVTSKVVMPQVVAKNQALMKTAATLPAPGTVRNGYCQVRPCPGGAIYKPDMATASASLAADQVKNKCARGNDGLAQGLSC